MSVKVVCDHCGVATEVKASRICPDHWVWAEVFMHDETGARIEGSGAVITICSEECERGFWRRGGAKVDRLTPPAIREKFER